MSDAQTPPPEKQPSAITRAEELLGRLGQRFTETRKRVSASLEQQAAAAQDGTSQPKERAEEIIDRLGHRIGYFSVLAGHQVRKFAARVREEAEDIWAEAQTRHQHTPPSQPPPDEPSATTP
jgi:hypothetical protein